MLLCNNNHLRISFCYFQITGVVALDLTQVIELQNAVTNLYSEIQAVPPKLCIYETQKEGYVLYVKESSVNNEYRNFLNSLVNSRNFRIRTSEDYIVIHGY